jgi:hypothetical protein
LHADPAPFDYAQGEDLTSVASRIEAMYLPQTQSENSFLVPSPMFLMLSVVEARGIELQPGWINALRPSENST